MISGVNAASPMKPFGAVSWPTPINHRHAHSVA